MIFAALAAAAIYFFAVEEPARRRASRERISSRRLLPYGPADVDEIALLNPYGETIMMERRRGSWRITWPVEDAGSVSTIEMFLSQIVPGQRLAEYEGVEDFAPYGLDTPYATVILHSQVYGRRDTVHVGDKTPTSFRAYLRLGDSDDVIVTRELARNVMQKTLYHLRDKNLLHVDSKDVVSLSVVSPGSRIDLERSGGFWLVSGTSLRADRAVIEPWLSGIESGLIYEFAAEDTTAAEAFGIGDPPRSVVLSTGSGSTRVEFGDLREDRVAAVVEGRNKVLMTEKAHADVFDWVRSGLLVMNLSLTPPGDVRGLLWESPDTSLALSLEEGSWSVSNGGGAAAVEGEAVKYLLMLTRSTSFEEIASDPGLLSRLPEAPSVRITLEGPGDSVLDVISIYRIPGGGPVGTSLSAGNAGYIRAGRLAELERAFSLIGGAPGAGRPF